MTNAEPATCTTTLALAPLPPPTTAADSPRRSTAKALAFGLLLATAGAGVGYLLGSLIPDAGKGDGLTRSEALMLFGALGIGMPILVLVHELGHLLGGRLVGFRFALLILGPLVLRRTATGLRLGTHRSPALWGGLALSVPTSFERLRQRTLWMVAGGPLASLTLGALLLGLGTLLSPDLAPTAFILGSASLALGAITLVPASTGGFFTDGARIRQLSRDDDAARRQLAMLTLTSLSMSGVRPRDWPEPVLAGLEVEEAGPFQLSRRTLAHAAALDRGDLVAARHYLVGVVEALGEAPPALQPSIAGEALWYEAVLRRDPVAAAPWFALTQLPGITEPWMRPRAALALAIAHGDTTTAAGERELALATLSDSMDPGGALAIADQIRLTASPPQSPPACYNFPGR